MLVEVGKRKRGVKNEQIQYWPYLLALMHEARIVFFAIFGGVFRGRRKSMNSILVELWECGFRNPASRTASTLDTLHSCRVGYWTEISDTSRYMNIYRIYVISQYPLYPIRLVVFFSAKDGRK